MTVLERMNEELYELERRGIKKVKGKRVDELGRRLFDATGTYILPEDRPPISKGVVNVVRRDDERQRVRKQKKDMRWINHLKSEEQEFGSSY